MKPSGKSLLEYLNEHARKRQYRKKDVALLHDDDVSEETKDEILKALEETGYENLED